MASCAACGRGFEPGDRQCPRCGLARGASRPPAVAGGVDAARASLLGATVEPGPPSPWAAPAGPLATPATSGVGVAVAAGADARPASPFLRAEPLVEPAALAPDGSLRVELVDEHADGDDDGHAELQAMPPGRWRSWARRGALVGLIVAALATAGVAVVRRDAPSTLTVQLVGGTATIGTDHVDAPVARWTYQPADGRSVVMAAQDAAGVYVLSRSGDGIDALTVDALALDTGEVRWTYDVTAVSGTIHATGRGVVLNVQDDRAVSATMLALGDGTVRWQLDGFVSQVPGSGRYGIVQQVSGRVSLGLQVIDLATGTERWRPVGSLRVGLGLDVVVDATCDSVAGRSADDGLERWRVAPADGGSFCVRGRPQITVAADRIVVAEDGDLVGYDATGREQWRRSTDGRSLAGSYGPYVQLRRRDAVADQVYVDATSGDPLDDAGVERLVGANRDRTVLARVGDETVVLLDQGDVVIRADRGTAAATAEPMPGAGTVGLGRTTVYRTTEGGDELLGYDLDTGELRWSVPLTLTVDDETGTPRVWSADEVVLVGTARGGLAALG